MSDFLSLAQRAAEAEGLLAGEVMVRLLREARSLVWPQPTARIPARPDGSPWGGDGLGPYSPEYLEWGRATEAFEKMVDAGAFVDASAALMSPGADYEIGPSKFVPHTAKVWPARRGCYYDGNSDHMRGLALFQAVMRERAGE